MNYLTIRNRSVLVLSWDEISAGLASASFKTGCNQGVPLLLRFTQSTVDEEFGIVGKITPHAGLALRGAKMVLSYWPNATREPEPGGTHVNVTSWPAVDASARNAPSERAVVPLLAKKLRELGSNR
jgi:hypothetical protein